MNTKKLTINTRYSKSSEYDYETRLERINLDAEKNRDILSGMGIEFQNPGGGSHRDISAAGSGIFFQIDPRRKTNALH